ncbi:hypothetical protein BG004_007589 [Podila humilis]|nr:hypothetical protein BG004_007589 [Podila humilis]
MDVVQESPSPAPCNATPASMQLPTEVLILIASYTDRTSLPSCMLVSNQWNQGFIAALWDQVSDTSLGYQEFAFQVPQHLHHIRHLFLTERTFKAADDDSQSETTLPLLHCRRLQTLQLDSNSGLEYLKTEITPSQLISIQRLFDRNHNTLKDLRLLNLPPDSDKVLQEIQRLSFLSSLALDGWDDLYSCSLRTILINCQNLESLALTACSLSADDTTFDDLETPPWTATSIQELILDRSTISMKLILNLALWMPQLRTLSLERTYGISHLVDEDFDSLDELESVDNQTDEINTNELFIFGGESNEAYSPDTEFSPHTETSDIGPTETMSVSQDSDPCDISPLGTEEQGSSYYTLANVDGRQSDLLGKFRQLHESCPNITSFDFTLCDSDGLGDLELKAVCRIWGKAGVQVLRFGGLCQLDNTTFSSIGRQCSQTLTVADFSLRQHGGQQYRGNRHFPEILTLLNTCCALQVLRVDDYPIRAKDISIRNGWASTKLRELGIWIEDTLGSTHHPNTLANVYWQLGRLRRLKKFILAGIEPCLMWNRKGWPSPLASPGWQDLANWRELEVLDIANLDPSGLSKQVLEWIAVHWMSLKSITATYLPASSVEAIDDVDAAAQLASIKGTSSPGLTTNRHKWVELSPVIDPVTNDGLSRFRALRPEVDTSAFADTFHMHLSHRGLVVVPPLELAQENTQEELSERRFVRKVGGRESAASQGSEETPPGGRENGEFMAEVMRPRGGRSPSPLGTWY